MDKQRAYYAVIPGNVRYDNSIPPNAKLLYGEITALCSEKGYCWAGNLYFSELYNVSKETVSRWVKTLADRGYITIDFIYKNGTKQIESRIIKLPFQLPLLENEQKETELPAIKDDSHTGGIDKNINTLLTKSSRGVLTKMSRGIDKNVKENNTCEYIHELTEVNSCIREEKNKKFVPPLLNEVQSYCLERNNGVDAQKFVDFYTAKGWYVGKNKMKDWKAAVRTWENGNKNKNISVEKIDYTRKSRF